MNNEDLQKRSLIHPEMTILDVLHLYPQTEAVFRKYDRQAGVCLCCQALFESLREIAQKYSVNLEMLLDDLKAELKFDKAQSFSQKPLVESSKRGTKL